MLRTKKWGYLRDGIQKREWDRYGVKVGLRRLYDTGGVLHKV